MSKESDIKSDILTKLTLGREKAKHHLTPPLTPTHNPADRIESTRQEAETRELGSPRTFYRNSF